MRSIIFSLGFLLFITSCTRIPDSQNCVSEIIQERVDQRVEWNQGCSIEDILTEEVTVETAVQIALIHNPQIQATFEEVGISQADLVEAGLMSNPIFDLFVRYPNKKGFVPDIEYSITAGFIDLFLIPLRKKVAQADLEKTTLIVANQMRGKMDIPPNMSPIGNPGPFGVIELGGMFTVFKVREHWNGEGDPGWYEHPKGTVAGPVKLDMSTTGSGNWMESNK